MYHQQRHCYSIIGWANKGLIQATAQDLRNFFSDVGGIKDVRILKDKFTGNSRVSPF